nr:glycoside hydrolase family 36 protein [Bifidobacterium miconis]
MSDKGLDAHGSGAAEARRLTPDADGRFTWGNGVVTMVFDAGADHPVSLGGLSGRGMAVAGPHAGGWTAQRDPRPIVEVLASGTGSNDNRLTLVTTVAGSKLRFAGARATGPASVDDGAPVGGTEPYRLEITQFAPYDQLRPAGRPLDSADPAAARRLAEAADPAVSGSGSGSANATSNGRAGNDYAVNAHDCGDCADTPAPADGLTDGLTVVSVFEAFPGLSAVRAYTVLRSPKPLPVEAVSSLSLTLPLDANGATVDSSRLYWGDNAWAVENDWHCAPLRDTAVRERNQRINPGESSSRFALSSASTWSTGSHQPAGIVEALADGSADAASTAGRASGSPVFSVMWQIEHNGAWEWEVGENDPGLHVTAFGPEYQDHQWFTSLGKGNDFTSVPVLFAVAAGDWQHAVGEMTLQRRALRRAKAAELGRLPQFERSQGLVVYNDYMNTLFGDPRLDKELPLIEGAAKAGADVFCIDAGWYDSTDGGWWDMVGEWEPSTNRFGKAGLAGVARVIREHGMGLGLWLEPEVIGVKSPLAASLPDDAFFTRHGVRVCDSGRYLLDFRSPAAREHVSRTVDRLVDEFGVEFFKFDYNTIPGTGTDHDAESVGGGLLDHCRAYLDWLDDVRRRHPDVMIENCGSGAMRADCAQLSRLDLQSTSDQCDPLIYAAIAAGAGLTILPEQQGNWGYAQQEMDDETAVLTLASGVLGRLYLSGFINRMNDTRLALVRDAIALHRRVLVEQERLVPWWPAGLPDFTGDWLTAGLRPVDGADASADASADVAYVTVWRRDGLPYVDLNVPAGRTVKQIFPAPSAFGHAPQARPWSVERVDEQTVRLIVSDDSRPSARIFAVR